MGIPGRHQATPCPSSPRHSIENQAGQKSSDETRAKIVRLPEIDLGECTDCGGCIEVCPSVFQRNKVTGLMEVADLAEYPEDAVNEAIKICPVDCITWVE